MNRTKMSVLLLFVISLVLFSCSKDNTVRDIDSNVYQTVQIGDQIWMAENLKVTHYRNGDEIPNVTSNSSWSGLSSGAYCVYGNNPSNADTYGYLYNWYAVYDSRELSPEGWHIPTDEEIKELEMALGMSKLVADQYNRRGTNEVSKLAGVYELWSRGALRDDPEFGSSGFSFPPGGCRGSSFGSFVGMGYYGMGNYGELWSSTEYSSDNAWKRYLHHNFTAVHRSEDNKLYGFSVRCVRD